MIQGSASATHSVVFTIDGRVFSWGFGQYGQLWEAFSWSLLTRRRGHGVKANETVPRCINSLIGIPIVSVGCGENFSVVCSMDGELYSWGRCRDVPDAVV